MQYGGVQVPYVNAVADDVVAELVGLAMDHASADTAAGHPHAEAFRVMVAAVVALR